MKKAHEICMRRRFNPTLKDFNKSNKWNMKFPRKINKLANDNRLRIVKASHCRNKSFLVIERGMESDYIFGQKNETLKLIEF